MMKANVFALVASVALWSAPEALAGPITPPPGPVASTHKTLTEVEPRTAINATNTRGDSNSVYKITQSGSYYLTANATGASGKSALEIAADNVTVDLMGYSLIGVPGSLHGVVTEGRRNNITVRNGTIRDFGGAGVSVGVPGAIGEGGLLADLSITGSGSHGCFPNDNSVVRACVANDNASSGFVSGSGVSFESCVSTNNNGAGFFASSDSSFIACVAISNSSGFQAGNSCLISDCTSSLNSGDGYVLIGTCMIRDSIAIENAGDGIQVWFQSAVLNNLCVNNGLAGGNGAGIHVAMGLGSRIEGNNCSNSDRGIHVDAPGNLVLRNSCSTNTVNYEIVAGNRYGPIVNITTGGTPAVSGNAAADTSGSTHPWANFAF